MIRSVDGILLSKSCLSHWQDIPTYLQSIIETCHMHVYLYKESIEKEIDSLEDNMKPTQ